MSTLILLVNTTLAVNTYVGPAHGDGMLAENWSPAEEPNESSDLLVDTYTPTDEMVDFNEVIVEVNSLTIGSTVSGASVGFHKCKVNIEKVKLGISSTSMGILRSYGSNITIRDVNFGSGEGSIVIQPDAPYCTYDTVVRITGNLDTVGLARTNNNILFTGSIYGPCKGLLIWDGDHRSALQSLITSGHIHTTYNETLIATYDEEMDQTIVRRWRINLTGDLNHDGQVDFGDFAVLASQWLISYNFPFVQPQQIIDENDPNYLDPNDPNNYDPNTDPNYIDPNLPCDPNIDPNCGQQMMMLEEGSQNRVTVSAENLQSNAVEEQVAEPASTLDLMKAIFDISTPDEIAEIREWINRDPNS
jgi:hypothetical protein